MKAVVYYAANDIRVEDRPAPQLNDNNMIAKVKCCALCGTDLKIWTAGNPRCHPPRILGHEMIAGIEQVGKNVKGFHQGKRSPLPQRLHVTTVRIVQPDYKMYVQTANRSAMILTVALQNILRCPQKLLQAEM